MVALSYEGVFEDSDYLYSIQLHQLRMQIKLLRFGQMQNLSRGGVQDNIDQRSSARD